MSAWDWRDVAALDQRVTNIEGLLTEIRDILKAKHGESTENLDTEPFPCTERSVQRLSPRRIDPEDSGEPRPDASAAEPAGQACGGAEPARAERERPR